MPIKFPFSVLKLKKKLIKKKPLCNLFYISYTSKISFQKRMVVSQSPCDPLMDFLFFLTVLTKSNLVLHNLRNIVVPR